MQKKKLYVTVAIVFLTFSIILAVFPLVSGAGSITLTPTSQAQGSSVTVAGTGFAASQPVGIVIGNEVTVTNETITTFSGTGTGPYLATLAHRPIKPGSFSMHWDTAGTTSDWTDNGDGTLQSSSTYSAGGTVNYVTGVFGRSSTTDISSYELTATCSYIYYQYTVTPTAGVNSSASGAFSTSVTVPTAVADGNVAVNAIDAKGGRGTATLVVNSAVPEGFSLGFIVILSATAVIASTYFFRKQPKTRLLNTR